MVSLPDILTRPNRKGALQPITVKTAQRAGKKVVTLVTNFEPFAEKWQSGQVPDLKAGLAQLDKQNDAALKLGQ